MGLPSFLGRVYDLDTLDTRFTSSSAVPYQAVVDARSDAKASRESARQTQARAQAQPPRWRTPEFGFYYVIFALAVPYMFWVTYDVSRRAWPSPGRRTLH